MRPECGFASTCVPISAPRNPNWRKHLHGNFFAIHFFEPLFRVPHIVCDLTKDAVANHHPRTTWFVVIKPDESWVAISGIQVRPVARKDVGVQVDFHGWIEQSPARCQFKRRSFKLKKSPGGAADPP